jgi:hypothetical protein
MNARLAYSASGQAGSGGSATCEVRKRSGLGCFVPIWANRIWSTARVMEWAKNYYRGWNVYWHTREHRMYAKEEGFFGSTHHFRDRPGDAATAFAIARAWIDSRR